MLKFFGAVILVLVILEALLAALADRADAAVRQPITRCGTKVVWLASSDNTTIPDGGEEAIRWAYAQVAPVARLQPRPSPDWSFDVEWHWVHALTSGDTTVETYATRGSDGGKRWTHTLNGDVERSLSEYKDAILVRVLRDLGVQEPTSTAAGLSMADRAAVKRICAAQAQSAAPARATEGSPAERKGSAPAEQIAPVEPQATDESTGTPSAPPAVRIAATIVAVLLALALGVWFIAPGVMQAVAAKSRNLRSDRSRPTTTEGGTK